MKILSLLFVIAMPLSSWAFCIDPMTINPAARLFNRTPLHRLFPECNTDEAMDAKNSQKMNTNEETALMQGSSEDYFADMDYGVTKNPQAVQAFLNNYIPGITADDAVARMARGRDNWMVWTAGNDRFWTYMTRATLGGFDLLKTISDYPSLPSTRHNRWQLLGLVNEPCFKEATGPREDRWGLWLPTRIVSPDCPADPFEDTSKYPGVQTGARGTTLQYQNKSKTLEVGSFYGYATGVVGLRLFTNPDFDQKAADAWDANRYYNDPAFYYDPNTVKPYRVGMACAFCHTGPNPSRPPDDFENPKWSNLNSNPGAQYFWVDRIFDWDYNKNQNNFIVQLLHTSRPGTVDTSLVSSDMINNPRTMNAVYDLPSRVSLAVKMAHREFLAGASTGNAQFSLLPTSVVPEKSGLRSLFDPAHETVISPRILKDGSDSVGALGALNRVYINIGLFSEEWIKHFIPLIGGPGVTPIQIKDLQESSLYWNATVNQTPDLGLFFLAASRPDKLSDAPGGAKYMTATADQLAMGRHVFARNCAQCHSSKLPDQAYKFFNRQDPMACVGDNYPACWRQYWDYAHTEPFKTAMETMVDQPDFLTHNYLSTELRVPANIVDTDYCSAVATNSIRNDIWDNFSSESYKSLQSVGTFKANYLNSQNQVVSMDIQVPPGGRGYFRPASLISVWSTAPYLQNNSVGRFDWHGTVDGRMSSFADSINKMLNPELRGQGAMVGQKVVTYTSSMGDQIPGGIIDVTTTDSYLKVPKGYLPSPFFEILKAAIGAQPNAPADLFHTPMKYKFSAVNTHATDKQVAEAMKVKDERPGFFSRLWASLTGSSQKVDLASNGALVGAAPADNDEMNEFINLGPIPAGVPVDLVANFDLNSNPLAITKAVSGILNAVIKIRTQHLTGAAAQQAFMADAGDGLIGVSRCKDHVVNRGHYFGTKYSPDKSEKPLSADEKAALIEYLKTM